MLTEIFTSHGFVASSAGQIAPTFYHFIPHSSVFTNIGFDAVPESDKARVKLLLAQKLSKYNIIGQALARRIAESIGLHEWDAISIFRAEKRMKYKVYSEGCNTNIVFWCRHEVTEAEKFAYETKYLKNQELIKKSTAYKNIGMDFEHKGCEILRSRIKKQEEHGIDCLSPLVGKWEFQNRCSYPSFEDIRKWRDAKVDGVVLAHCDEKRLKLLNLVGIKTVVIGNQLITKADYQQCLKDGIDPDTFVNFLICEDAEHLKWYMALKISEVLRL